ncbi:uncharacterized protein LOC110887038 [Helianthus annuus]|uniref:uncharacterized protein LOC110887038 n=1 Tax=Helianthus annuus TaxID=4232 RepID=UPI000B8F1B06|nr:uncharacterized protein LOC110887038 [Helianthus annuus]
MEDDGEEVEKSQPRTRVAALNRDRAHEHLVGNYFAGNCVYTDEQFRHRFRMSRRLFVRIASDLANYDDLFIVNYDARGIRGFTTFQKCTSAVRQIAYGTASDSWDEYLTMSERMSRECLYEFTKGIVNLYNKVYLCRPTKKDIKKLYVFYEERHGFPEMLGSIDCTQLQWHNRLTAWREQHTCGDIVSNNDLSVLPRSHILEDLIRDDGRAICKYDPNDVHENVEPVDEEQQQSNLWALCSEHVHGNLCADLINYIWNTFCVDHVDNE